MANDRFCCFRVHTIGMVLGWLGAIGGVIGIVIFGLILGNLDKIVTEIIKQDPNNLDYASVRAALLAVLIVGLILTTINLLASVLLIIGTVKNKHLLILPWLVNNCFAILYTVIATAIIISNSVRHSEPARDVFPMVIPSIIGLLIQITLWSAIHKLFRTIREQTTTENQRLLQGGTAPSYTRL